MYADKDLQAKAVQQSRRFAKLYWEYGSKTNQSILVGPNWTVVGDLTLLRQL